MSYWKDEEKIEVLKGKTIAAITTLGTHFDPKVWDQDEIIFHCSDGTEYIFTHFQECCEHVGLEDIAGGTLTELIGDEILEAYETHEGSQHGDWTFYTVRTNKVTLTLRWYGEHNYYSTSVYFGPYVAR